MADDKIDMSETNTRGTDWEVVSLTASTYAAAPGPQRFDPNEQQEKQEFNRTGQDCAEAVFMSKHFTVPQQEPEKLPSEHYHSEIRTERSLVDGKFIESHRFSKDKSKFYSDSELFDTGHSLSDNSMEFGDGKQREGLKIVEKEDALFFTPNYSNFGVEVDMSLPILHDDISNLGEPRNSSPDKLDNPSWPASCKPSEENGDESFDESHEAWWKKKVMCVYNHAKGTNTIWSIFVAVAMAGLVILGQRWRREKTYFQQFKWKLSADEKINRMAGPASPYKFLVGGSHRGRSMREGLHPSF